MEQTPKDFLMARGFGLDGLNTEAGEFFALLTARAKDHQRSLEGKEFAQTRAVVTVFCQMVIGLAEKAKFSPDQLSQLGVRQFEDGQPGIEFEKAEKPMGIAALVRVCADPVQLDSWANTR
jgi:hypothetical protein